MKSKMTTNLQLSTMKSKSKNKNKLSKQPEQVQNHRNGDHMEDCQRGRRRGRVEEKVQGMSSINGRYKIYRVRLIIV